MMPKSLVSGLAFYCSSDTLVYLILMTAGELCYDVTMLVTVAVVRGNGHRSAVILRSWQVRNDVPSCIMSLRCCESVCDSIRDVLSYKTR